MQLYLKSSHTSGEKKFQLHHDNASALSVHFIQIFFYQKKNNLPTFSTSSAHYGELSLQDLLKLAEVLEKLC